MSQEWNLSHCCCAARKPDYRLGFSSGFVTALAGGWKRPLLNSQKSHSLLTSFTGWANWYWAVFAWWWEVKWFADGPCLKENNLVHYHFPAKDFFFFYYYYSWMLLFSAFDKAIYVGNITSLSAFSMLLFVLQSCLYKSFHLTHPSSKLCPGGKRQIILVPLERHKLGYMQVCGLLCQVPETFVGVSRRCSAVHFLVQKR